jgi:hypothetical protein
MESSAMPPIPSSTVSGHGTGLQEGVKAGSRGSPVPHHYPQKIYPKGEGNLMVICSPRILRNCLIISTVIIYAITKILRKRKVLGTLMESVQSSCRLRLAWTGFVAVITGIFWLVALQLLYKIGWIKSLIIAVVIWVVASIVGLSCRPSVDRCR